MDKLPNRIREVRKAKGLTLQGLGDLVGTNATQVKRLEEGDRKLSVQWMDRISSALQCKPAELLNDFDPKVDALAAEAGEIYEQLSEENKRIATRLLESLLKEQSSQR